MHSVTDTFTLANGIKIPCIGFGTWQAQGDDCRTALSAALKAGYRHIDTAAAYNNEVEVGEAIAQSGIPREKIFLTSKLWNKQRGYESALAACDESLRKLGTDYLDLYLIHWPANAKQFPDACEGINQEAWRGMEKILADGKARAIGVSNFHPHHLEIIARTATVTPMVNQIEYNPGFTQPNVVSYCQNRNILVQAWSPLGSGRLLNDPGLAVIAGHYGKSVAQLCIRFALQRGILPIPKSITPARIVANTNVFDFEITKADMSAIDDLPVFGNSGHNPDEVSF
jgi:diketogulonate reductase-like aldo/keto reductase